MYNKTKQFKTYFLLFFIFLPTYDFCHKNETHRLFLNFIPYILTLTLIFTL